MLIYVCAKYYIGVKIFIVCVYIYVNASFGETLLKKIGIFKLTKKPVSVLTSLHLILIKIFCTL